MSALYRYRILVVDDNIDNAVSLAMILERMGHDVRMAFDGQQAVEAAEAFRPDVALLDIGLPKLSGHEVARRIRAEAWGKSMFLIAATGWGQEEDRRRSAEAGFDLHMVKPLDPAALESLLLGLRSTVEEARRSSPGGVGESEQHRVRAAAN